MQVIKWTIFIVTAINLSIAVFGSQTGINLRGQGIRDAFAEIDLLSIVQIPLEDGLNLITGIDGFPAYHFKPNAQIKSPLRVVLPDKLQEFAIMTTIRTDSRTGGYIFSIVNPLDTIVQLGIFLSPVQQNKMNVSLMYTDPNEHMSSQKLVTIEIAYTKSWFSLAFVVLSKQVTFHYNCQEMNTINVQRIPTELDLDLASTLYLAQAGHLLRGNFEGAIQFLKIYGNPGVVPIMCNQTFLKYLDGKDRTASSEDDTYEEGFSDSLEGSGGSDSLTDYETGVDVDEFSGIDDKFPPPPFPPPPDKVYRGSKGDKGDRGSKGDKGDNIRGAPGPPGPPGPAGPPGIPGPSRPYDSYDGSGESELMSGNGLKGPPGECSCNVTTILETLKYDDLFRESVRGPPGLSGKEGKTGAPGLTGATGVPGERGASGPIGERGDRGDPGPLGPEGLQGSKGEPGVDGVPGLMGPPGPPGSPGLPENYEESLMVNTMHGIRGGGVGPKGDTGEKGELGLSGEKGTPGSKGERGDPGLTGIKGERGHQGPHGPAGSKGEQGTPGMPGLSGLSGAVGAKGDKGLQGDAGPEGPAGPPGTVVYSDVKNTTECQCQTGPAGPPGIRGPSGFDGLPGASGEIGPMGMIGSPGLPGEKGEKGEKGPRGIGGPKGERGLEGPPGPGSYFSEGNAFNITKGDKGDRGLRGRRGKTGAPGTIGPPGKPGSIGEIGWTGRPGPLGAKGDLGPKGQKGDSSGIPGEKGDKGEAGRDGKPGMGSADSYIPVPGPPGPPGPPGLSLMGPKGEPGLDARGQFYGDTNFYGKQAPGPSGETDGIHSPYGSLPINTKIVPGAVTFQNTDSMTKMSSVSPVGTIAYIIDEEALLIRVNKGWQYIALGTLLPIATPSPPTTIAPPPRPDLQASNLINNVPQPVDGASLRMAALNEPYTGDLQGLRGADFACYRQARRAGLIGTFRAFLSARIQNLDSIVRSTEHDLPVVNTRGDVLFNSWNGIFNGQGGFFLQAPRIYSFSGKNVLTDITWPQKLIWHGSSTSGERAMDTYCDAWHSSSSDKVGLASSLLGNKLLDQERYSCDNRFVVLCIEALTQDRRKKRELESNYVEPEFTSEDEYAVHLEKLFHN